MAERNLGTTDVINLIRGGQVRYNAEEESYEFYTSRMLTAVVFVAEDRILIKTIMRIGQ